MSNKMYPFSVRLHAHDIELYAYRLYNVRTDMERGHVAMDATRYSRICSMYDGELRELRLALISNVRGPVCYLTGPQIALAKRIVAWASEERALRMPRKGEAG